MILKIDSKKTIIVLFCILTSITNVLAMNEATSNVEVFDFKINQKPLHLPTYNYCVQKAKENYYKNISKVLNLLGVSGENFDNIKKNICIQIIKKEKEKINNNNKAIPENIKTAINYIVKNKTLKNRLRIKNVKFHNNSIFINTLYGNPIIISHTDQIIEINNQKHTANAFHTLILINYDQTARLDEKIIRSKLRKKLAKIINHTYANEQTIFHLEKNKNVNEQQFATLFDNITKTGEILSCITSTFDDLQALQELMDMANKNRTSNNVSLIQTLQDMRAKMLVEKYYTEHTAQAKQALENTYQKNPQGVETLEKFQAFASFYDQMALDYEHAKHVLQPGETQEAINKFKEIISKCEKRTNKILLKYYVKSKLILAEFYLQAPNVPDELIREAIEFVNEIEKQYFYSEERVEAKYEIFKLHLKGYKNIFQPNIKKAFEYFNDLSKQCVHKEIRARALCKMGSYTINYHQNLSPQKREIAFKQLMIAAKQNDHLLTKKNALIQLMYLNINNSYRNLAIQEAYNTLEKAFNGKIYTIEHIDIIRALLRQKDFVSDHKKTKFILSLLRCIYEYFRQNKTKLSIRALKLLISTNANIELQKTGIKEAVKFMRELYEKKDIACTHLITPLVAQNVNRDARIEAYNLLHKIIFSIDDPKRKKDLICLYFRLANNILDKDKRSGTNLLEITSNQNIHPEIKKKSSRILQEQSTPPPLYNHDTQVTNPAPPGNRNRQNSSSSPIFKNTKKSKQKKKKSSVKKKENKKRKREDSDIERKDKKKKRKITKKTVIIPSRKNVSPNQNASMQRNMLSRQVMQNRMQIQNPQQQMQERATPTPNAPAYLQQQILQPQILMNPILMNPILMNRYQQLQRQRQQIQTQMIPRMQQTQGRRILVQQPPIQGQQTSGTQHSSAITTTTRAIPAMQQRLYTQPPMQGPMQRTVLPLYTNQHVRPMNQLTAPRNSTDALQREADNGSFSAQALLDKNKNKNFYKQKKS